MNIIVKYVDSKGKTHNLETERIDVFIHEHNILIELKAIQKEISNQEKAQLEKYINELNKIDINVSNAIVINFPQPNNTFFSIITYTPTYEQIINKRIS